MKISRRAILPALLATAATTALYGVLSFFSQGKPYYTTNTMDISDMGLSRGGEGKACLYVEGKGEVVGNLIAAKLADKGVGFFTYGEYFEAEPFLIIPDQEIKIIKNVWIDGVAYRTISIEEAVFEEKLFAYGDTLVYKIRNTSDFEKKFKINGMMQVFSWFLPESRNKIAEIAGSNFRYHDGELVGFYSNNGPYITIKSNNKIAIKQIEQAYSNFEIDTSLAPSEEFILTVAGHQSSVEVSNINADKAIASPETIERMKRRELCEMLINATKKNQVKKEFESISKYMWYVILSNRARVENHPILKNPFVMPSKFGLRHQWLWDSAFHAIVLSKYSLEMAKQEILNLFYAQKKDGRIPHEIFLSKEFCKLFWNVDDYTPWTTQPPVLALAVARVLQMEEDRKFAEIAYESLDRYDKWFRSQRDKDGDQLMCYVDYLESGWDDSVRWDEPKRIFNDNPEKYKMAYSQVRMAPVEAIDLNCLIYLQRKILSNLAEKLGHNNESEEYQKLAERTASGINELMWDEEKGFYYDIYEKAHKIIGVKTPAAFLTLYAEVTTQQQAQKLVKHLFNSHEFWTTFPLPTVSADDPRHDPRGYWRGRSWLNIIWFTYHGLKKYGFDNEARMLAQRVIDIMNEGPSCSENYDSQNGEPLGVPDFGWSTLALDFLT
ncbi:MAG: trehalase family glycosidase [Nitrososphaerota archaeon]